MPFQVLNLDNAPREIIEQLGTKQKFWTTIPELGRCLCKTARPGTGEDWSEVVAAQIASMMGLPHAQYFLGDSDGEPVVVTPSFLQGPQSTLILGNALLMQVDPTYNVGAVWYRQNTHAVDLVVTLLEDPKIGIPRDCPASAALQTAADVFVGYLALDALIGNTDRHHENWGLVVEWEADQAIVRLAPTFDHASSLGCHEQDDEKERRLQTRDRNSDCASYAARARSAFFLEPTDPRPTGTRNAFRRAAQRHRGAATYWIDSLLKIRNEDFDIVLGDVPPHRLSNISRRFALQFLISNHRYLSEIQL